MFESIKNKDLDSLYKISEKQVKEINQARGKRKVNLTNYEKIRLESWNDDIEYSTFWPDKNSRSLIDKIHSKIRVW